MSSRPAADRAYRWAWAAVVLYPVSFVAAFVIGEGILARLVGTGRDPAGWEVVVAATPALLVFVLPGVLAVREGRRAIRLGRRDGNVPAIVGAAIGGAFVAANVGSYVLARALG